MTCFRGGAFRKWERLPEAAKHVQDLHGWRSQCAVRAVWAPRDMRNLCTNCPVLSRLQTNHSWTGSGAEVWLMVNQLFKGCVKGTKQCCWCENERPYIRSCYQRFVWTSAEHEEKTPLMPETLFVSSSILSHRCLCRVGDLSSSWSVTHHFINVRVSAGASIQGE